MWAAATNPCNVLAPPQVTRAASRMTSRSTRAASSSSWGAAGPRTAGAFCVPRRTNVLSLSGVASAHAWGARVQRAHRFSHAELTDATQRLVDAEKARLSHVPSSPKARGAALLPLPPPTCAGTATGPRLAATPRAPALLPLPTGPRCGMGRGGPAHGDARAQQTQEAPVGAGASASSASPSRGRGVAAAAPVATEADGGCDRPGGASTISAS